MNLMRWPVLWPGTFGTHDLFHLFVMAGSLAHYWLILTVVVPFRWRSEVESRADRPAGSRRADIDFSPDGRELLMTAADGRGAIWDVDPMSWAQRACRLANRTLTPEEWEEFLPGRPYEPACAT